MGLPRPPVELTGSCSVVYNSTLYAFSPSGFQSIDLREGGTWTTLPTGVAVTGGACVKAVPNDDPKDAALYIVGGVVKDTTLTNYTGIQRFSFATQTWKWVSPVTPVTQNRQNHAAVYLNASSSILVYAGTQDGSDGLSSQTFLISTNPPYDVQAFTSNAPPGVSPMLLPWDESHAVMLGGKYRSPADSEMRLLTS
jgi:hypothetical protein